MGFWLRLLSTSVLLTVSAATPTVPDAVQQPSLASTTPLPPSQDPFYTAPPNYELAAPGAVLRVRPAPGNLSTIIGNCSAAYNILYRTTDGRYRPSWAVTTLFVPKSSNKSALVSYQIPYNSADVDASPSYALYGNSLASDINDNIPDALGRGWYLNVPDFQGPLASFTLGPQEGHATLDSVRAVLSSGFGLANNARYALWGYSGGGLAVDWAAELQEAYAPELNFAGAALGGLTPSVLATLDEATGTYFTGLIPMAVLGITSQYPEAYDYIYSRLKPTGSHNRTTFLLGKNITLEEAFTEFQGQDGFSYFVGGRADLDAPIMQKIFNNTGIMGNHGIPQMPLFVYKAINDELSAVQATDSLVNKYCSLDANILYQRNTVGGHIAEITNGEDRAFTWLTSVLDGTYSKLYSTKGCTIQDVTVNITSSTL
ncbi:hypothetical protein B7463_g8698, partial [Scytalidium lignicola]